MSFDTVNSDEFIYKNNPTYTQIGLSNGNTIRFYYDVESSSKNLVADVIDQQGKEITNKILISPTDISGVAYSQFIPETSHLTTIHQLLHGSTMMKILV